MPKRRTRPPLPDVGRYALLAEIATWPRGFSPVDGVPSKLLNALVQEGVVDLRYAITYRGVRELTPLDREAHLVTHALPGKTGLWIDAKEHIVPGEVASHFKFLAQQLDHMTRQATRYHTELVTLRQQVEGDVTPIRRRAKA
jgi:hypothetical protein